MRYIYIYTIMTKCLYWHKLVIICQNLLFCFRVYFIICSASCIATQEMSPDKTLELLYYLDELFCTHHISIYQKKSTKIIFKLWQRQLFPTLIYVTVYVPCCLSHYPLMPLPHYLDRQPCCCHSAPWGVICQPFAKTTGNPNASA